MKPNQNEDAFSNNQLTVLRRKLVSKLCSHCLESIFTHSMNESFFLPQTYSSASIRARTFGATTLVTWHFDAKTLVPCNLMPRH